MAVAGRRWYLVIVAVLLSGAASFWAVGQVGPTYTAEGTVLLFPPKMSTTTEGDLVESGNPYLELNGLTPARDVLIRTLTSKSSRLEIAERYPSAGYTAVSDFTNSGPIVLFDVTGATNDEAIGALHALMDRVPSTLHGLQARLGIPESTFITSEVLTKDPEADIVHKSQIRAGIVAGAGTLTLLLLAIGHIDGVVASRSRRHGAQLRSVDRTSEEPAPPQQEESATKRGSRRPRVPTPSGAASTDKGAANPLRKV